MAKSARDHVYEAMELIPAALIVFVETRLLACFGDKWRAVIKERVPYVRVEKDEVSWDQHLLFRVMDAYWAPAFKDVLGKTVRSYVNELVEVHHKHSHNKRFSYDDAARALDTIGRLLEAVDAREPAKTVENMRKQILHTQLEEQRRNEERKKPQHESIVAGTGGAKPWRDVVEPHKDVATGSFSQAEFAADLNKVHGGTASSEYLDPHEFFSRTFLTRGLQGLLKEAAKRLFGKGGAPVVELQTNFGGGKTHSLLALYHMVGGSKLQDLPGLDQLLDDVEVKGKVNRAILVGTARGPMDVTEIEDGLSLQTTWGHMAYQLGGKSGYEMVRATDEQRVSPGSEVLSDLFKAYSPCLILIDEWVAYLRQIYRTKNLPSGNFDVNLSFAQSLTEAVKDVPGTLLVASLPASQIEIGGEGGEQALARLKQTFGRLHSSWQPASQEESYEIVRRRLFNDVPGENAHHKTNAIKQYMNLYSLDANNFPQGSSDSDYMRKLAISYPIHPELFDQLYENWNSIEHFQRTRGILRLMAQVVHELWVKEDSSIMIMPGGVPVGLDKVSAELNKYLDPGWPSIIAADVDGANSRAIEIDKEVPSLGKISATRRVARALFMSTAPLPKIALNPGLDIKSINLAVAQPQPGDVMVKFSDALHRLSGSATHLHSDGDKYWFATAPSLNKLAREYAKQYDDNLIIETIDKHLRDYIKGNSSRDYFDGIHCAPGSSADISDDVSGCRVVVFGVQHSHAAGNSNSTAFNEARNIINTRGPAPRENKNVLVFIAPDAPSLDNVKSETRILLAWKKILDEQVQRNLAPADVSIVQSKINNSQSNFDTRLRDAWKWIINPFQPSAKDEIEYQAWKVTAQDLLFKRILQKLEENEAIFTTLGPDRLSHVLEKYIWQDRPHLKTEELLSHHARFIYMPRLINRSVLQDTILSSVSQNEPGKFAYAQYFDEGSNKYEGLVIDRGTTSDVDLTHRSVIVQSEVAINNRDTTTSTEQNVIIPEPLPGEGTPPIVDPLPKNFHGTFHLSSERPNRDMEQIVEGIIEQLLKMDDVNVNIKTEIDAIAPKGIDSSKKRILLENSAQLGSDDAEVW